MLHSTDEKSLNKQGDYSFIRIYWPSIGLVTMPVTPPTTPWNHNKNIIGELYKNASSAKVETNV